MPMLGRLIDVITMKSDRPMRRLLAYYGIVTVIVLLLAYFFPRVALRIGATGLGAVSENPTALLDALNAQPAVLSLGVGTLADTALTLLLLLFGTLVLMLPVSWVYMSARPLPGHSQTIVQTLLILPPVVAGIVFIILGVGTIRGRRWARALWLVLSGGWLVSGVVGLAGMVARLTRRVRWLGRTTR